MEILIIIGVGAWIYSAIYSSGKREGSRKGYGVGRSHQRRANRRR